MPTKFSKTIVLLSTLTLSNISYGNEEPVGELGICYRYTETGKPKAVVTIYGGRDTNHAEYGDAISEEIVECFDTDLYAKPLPSKIEVIGRGNVSIWTSSDPTVEEAQIRATDHALIQCRVKLGQNAKAVRISEFTYGSNIGSAWAYATYRCNG